MLRTMCRNEKEKTKQNNRNNTLYINIIIMLQEKKI